ncbi:MAG: alkene reductase, partial [Deltaproteobacteria bacterium]|nr:alkene reductase [Deltaproteobacteria bacterium]
DRVGIRLSPTGPFNDMHDSNPQATFGYLLRELSKLNLSYVHIIERQRGDAKHGEQPLPLSFYRETYKGNLVLNGGFDLQRGNEVIAEGLAEAVAFGQLFISNPDLPVRFKTGAALNEADVSTFYGGAEKGYTDYPALSA